MKKAEAQKLLQAGYIGFIGEYRGGTVSEIPYVSKTTGKSMVMKMARHNIEVGTQVVSMGEPLKDEFDIKTWTPPVLKGSQVLVELSSLANDKGSLKARGKVFPLVD